MTGPDVDPDEAGLAARIARLEAATAIRQLPARYTRAYGALDTDDLSRQYVDDVVVTETTSGRAALAARFSSGCDGPAGVRLAILPTGTHVIDLDPDDPDQATGAVYSRAEVERADGSSFQQAIHYGDRYRRTPEGWRFARHRRHELFYGVPRGQRPNGQPAANWPERDVGTGSVPHRWDSWQAFHAEG